jgi:putative ABC transport system permease protein
MADKRTAFINLFGLAVGLTGFLLIIQYVWYEKSYDQFHKNKDRTYRIGLEVYRDNKLNIRSSINYAGVGPSLKDEYSEVEDYVRIVSGESDVQIGANHFREENTFFADASLFKIFSIPLLAGDAASALEKPNSAAIAESVALKYFGTVNCVGQRLTAHNAFNQHEFLVTAVFGDLPQNTHLAGNIFLSFSTYNNQPGFIQPWQWRDFHNYVLLKQNANAQQFVHKITRYDFVNAHNKVFAERKMKHHLVPQKITDVYLHGGLAHELNTSGNAAVTNMLLVIAVFVLGMAWINFINLSTAAAIKRVKEIGVRKAIGALRGNLVMQFITETFLLNGIALVLAVGLFFLLKPAFVALAEKNMAMPSYAWAGVVVLLLFGVLLSVWYPSMVSASFSPLKALKDEKISTNKGGQLRRVLIIFQFAVSAVLIIGTLVVVQQLNYMRKAPLGLDIDQTIVVRAPIPADSVTYSKYLVFKETLLKNPVVKSVTASHVVPGDEGHWTPAIRKLADIDQTAISSITASANAIEPGFLKQYNIPVLYGRELSKDFGTDNSSVLLTEAACRQLGYQNPADALGDRMLLMGDTFAVVGITGDFRHFSVKYNASPYVFFQWITDYRKFSVKVSAGDMDETISFIKREYEKTFPQHAFEYVFNDELFARQYASEKKLSTIISIFAGLSVCIACLGLFGLTVFITQQRVKEIGIRKVLGAGVAAIATLLSKDFLKLVIVSVVVAFPVSWWLMNKWLEGFAYRINIGWQVFAVTGVSIMVIAFVTVGLQAVKAALSNPVKSLRTE